MRRISIQLRCSNSLLFFALLALFPYDGLSQITGETDSEIDRVVVATPTSHGSNSARLPSDLLEQTKAALRAESLATTRSARVLHAIELVELLKVVRNERSRARSRLLRSAEQRLLTRLRGIQKRTIVEMKTHRRRARLQVSRTVLAQLGQAVADNRGQDAAQPGVAQRQAAASQDYGPLLVELIQQTISPQRWDVNGGISSIQYWRPGNALVIRAPQPVHEEIAPLLMQLRKQ